MCLCLGRQLNKFLHATKPPQCSSTFHTNCFYLAVPPHNCQQWTALFMYQMYNATPHYYHYVWKNVNVAAAKIFKPFSQIFCFHCVVLRSPDNYPFSVSVNRMLSLSFVVWCYLATKKKLISNSHCLLRWWGTDVSVSHSWWCMNLHIFHFGFLCRAQKSPSISWLLISLKSTVSVPTIVNCNFAGRFA